MKNQPRVRRLPTGSDIVGESIVWDIDRHSLLGSIWLVALSAAMTQRHTHKSFGTFPSSSVR